VCPAAAEFRGRFDEDQVCHLRVRAGAGRLQQRESAFAHGHGDARTHERLCRKRQGFLCTQGEQVLVEARISGLTPGLHGFHVHERGNCTAPDGSSAGPHFNPHSGAHGGPESSSRHAGDLGNIEAGANGVAVYRAEVRGISLGTGVDSIIGRSVIVHEKPDDLSSQPAGNSGARLACGLISKSADKWF